ncbi:T9SS type A sorting domain-containing protein [Candidatus Eisenbacteria bacterium]|uniref:T9SS type A sorting domain-containing protein n=1 Tax=Eiseniibacteriota bacterium TaxID=2212470 RepID=A0ABV6YI61_UNCEI
MKKSLLLFSIILLFPAIPFAECTIGLALGSATSDGRPVIFKNRDIAAWNLRFKTFTPSGYHAYVGNTYEGSSTVWMGVNEVGFGIVQSAAYNLPGGGSGLNNGSMMAFALQRCTRVADFAAILDSTDNTGRATAANFAVIDALGDGAMFECGSTTHARYDPDALGIVVRANFAYIGDGGRVGLNRMERAYQLMSDAHQGDSLDARFVAKHVVADLVYPDQDPYPLPWTGSFSGMPAGYVNTGPFTGVQTICNYNTRACGVVHGVPNGEDPANALMWCFFGQPVLSIPLPIFPASHNQPPEATGSPAPMCDLVHDKSNAAFDDPTYSYYLDTAEILDVFDEGVWSFSWPAMDWAFQTVAEKIADWDARPPLAGERADFQDLVAADLYRAYDSEAFMDVIVASLLPETALDVQPSLFSATCRIQPARPDETFSDIEILDVSGRRVAQSDGAFTWEPEATLSAGVYLVRARVGETTLSQRVVYMK